MAEIVDINPDIIEELLRQTRQRQNTPQEAVAPNQGGRVYGGNRVPFHVATESMLTTEGSNESRRIICFCNPAECTWTFGQRAAKQKVKGGTAYHLWPRMKSGKKTYWDEPTVNLAFQSGNILPIRGAPSNPVPAGLQNFYDFMKLFDEVPILPDGRTNWTFITYNSRVFPEITLVGRFDPEGINFTDTSTDPNQINWTGPFTIDTSFPFFADPTVLMQTFQQARAPSTSVESSEGFTPLTGV